MAEGLDVGINEFKRMASIDRDILMYKNLVHVRRGLKGYTFHKRIQYVWLIALTSFLGIKKFLGI